LGIGKTKPVILDPRDVHRISVEIGCFRVYYRRRVGASSREAIG